MTFLLFALSISIQAQETPLIIESRIDVTEPSACSGRFVVHELDHVTTVPGGDAVRQFEANGSGLAINDLDNDGDLDIVLANHAGMNSILWNEGELNFRVERLTHGDSRGVTIVDVDGDDWNDIFFTRTVSAPSYWRNLGNGQFEQLILSHIAEPLYSVAWADMDGDGDLDLVGGSYDAALLDAFGQEFLLNARGGVYYYQNFDGVFRPIRLVYEAQALALVLVDTNGDDRLDIVVGNDFAVPDYIWVQTDTGWQANHTFNNTSHSTMSYDFGDVDNDGVDEIFSTDMKPYESDAETLAVWDGVLSALAEEDDFDATQVMENVLLRQNGETSFDNHAETMGVDATGWSWSGKFGDLDQDGLLDLYVVNGFIEYTIFGHLDQHELVEKNQVFRNVDGGTFQPMPAWGLASEASGRAMSMADLDLDGDLDIVVNNLRNPAQLFENQLCTGRSLQVDLEWDRIQNRRVIGAELVLYTDQGNYYRTVKSSSGYLAGDPSRVHFGFPADAVIDHLEINWGDGGQTTLLVPDDAAIVTVRR